MILATNRLNETVTMRDWFKKYHNEKSSFNYYMSTTSLGFLMPEIEEEFGIDKKVDVEVTIS